MHMLWRLIKNRYVFLVEIVLLLFLINIVPIRAQNHALKFDHLTIEQGLSQSTVYGILQDRDGFMWFGTQDGLNKFDGYEFTVFKHDKADSTSLSDNYINCLYEDHSGTLWIGTFSGGLNQFDKNTGQFIRYQHNPADSTCLSKNNVHTIFEDRTNQLWIGTLKGGLCKLDRETGQFTCFRHDPENPNSLSDDDIMAISQDREGLLWFGTFGGGLNKFDLHTGIFTHYKNDPADTHSLSNDYIRTILEDSSGDLWIGTETGLDKFDKKKAQFTHFQHLPEQANSLSHNDVRAICEDQLGRLWVGTLNGLNLFDRKSQSFTIFRHDEANKFSLNHSDVRSIYEDRTGAIWFGTLAGGISKYDRKKYKFQHFKQTAENGTGLSDNHIKAIYEDKQGTLWIGTYGGLNQISRSNPDDSAYDSPHRVVHFKHDESDPNSLSSNRIRTICEDSAGQLWIGTWGAGLNRFNKITQKFTRFRHSEKDSNSLSNDNVSQVFRDRAGDLWIATSGGLDKISHQAQSRLLINGMPSLKFEHYRHSPDDPNSLSDKFVSYIYEDRSGVLWIGTGNGLNRFDRDGEQFQRFQHRPNDPNSLSNNRIQTIQEDGAGFLWIGTVGGLNRFDPKAEIFKHYGVNEGLPNEVIYGILVDDSDNLWISTNRGLSRFNPRTEIFKNYDVNDGLQSNEFNGGAYWKSADGEMFFGGVNGFNTFYPEKVTNNPFVPNIVITSFRIFNQEVRFPHSLQKLEEITLSYDENFFSFEFAALDYTSPEKNQYAYMLEGFDQNWIYSQNRRYASYTNLNSGDYVFRVKGSNNDGTWNHEGVSIKICITPPYWQTWWFRLLSSFSFITLIYGVYYSRVKTIQAQKLKLSKQVAERTRELHEHNQKLLLHEKALKESEKRFRTLFNNAGDAIFINDLESRFLEANKVATELLGYSREEFLQMSPKDIETAENAALIPERMEAIRKHGRHVFESELFRKDGTLLPVEISAKLIDIDGQQAILSVCRDITERRRMQVELARAQRMETAGRVAGQIAHDFNNLLSPLSAYPSLIREYMTNNQEVLEMLEEMEFSAHKIAEINHQLLTLGRRGHYAMEPLNLNELLHKVLLSQDIANQIAVKEELEAELLLVNGGAAQLTRALINLITNAKEAMTDGGVLTLKTQNIYLEQSLKGYKTIKRGEYVKLEISDTGPGIAPEIADKIFDPFFTTKKMDKVRGSGLGLSVVYSVIEDHHGYITLDSAPGKGAAFTLYFPVTRNPEITKLAKQLRGGSENILIVDDDPIQRKVASQLLKRLGYQTHTAASGEDAVSLAKNQKHDLLVVDMVMDGIDGTETYRQILEFQPDQKAIILSGYAVTQRVEEAIHLGAGTFISKPISLNVLANAVRTELDRKK
ncbi:MAG: two-component regulator propeller domain-containing protein [bacterium]